jgi:hypothetical protein
MKRLITIFNDNIETRGLPSSPPPNIEPAKGGGSPSTTPPASGDRKN